MNLIWALGLGSLVLAVHLVSVALAKALRSYSRSRLEEICAARGHAPRADDVAHLDEATEQSAEGLAVITGLLLAALLAAMAPRVAPLQTGFLVAASALTVTALGYLLAGAIGHVYAEGVIDRLWPAVRLLRAATTPVTLTRRLSAELVASLARRGAGARRPSSVEVEIPSDGASDEVVEADLPESLRELIQQAVELTRRDVSELMMPRSAIVTLPSSVTAAAAARIFRETGRSRIPVFGENRDDIVGILYAKDLFPRMTEPGGDGSDGPEAVIPRNLVRPAHFVPETKNAYELLQEFRSRRIQIAMVLDEYGGVAGLITLEDLLEALVGAIEDEHDAPSPGDPLTRLGNARFEVDATLELEQLNDLLELRLPTEGDFLTVGGLALHALGRVPEPGTSFRYAGVDFTVVEVVDHTIRRVQIDLQPSATVGSS
jgi:CBS domain containing-hemolysin-like protein